LGYLWRVERLDLNLLVALDVLLAEGSVTDAARHLGLSTSAMSRTLTRLRAATGDPLLVRAGRQLVQTPHAEELRDRVANLVKDGHALLRPVDEKLDIASLHATFTIRVGRWFMEAACSSLVTAVAEAAPHVRLRFVPKTEKDLRSLREGQVDLEIGLVGALAPEVRTRTLFRDALVGVVRVGHPLLAAAKVTTRRLASYKHVQASQWGDFTGPLDESLKKRGFDRTVSVVVPGFPDALRVARATDLVAVVPRSCFDGAGMSGLRSFTLPIAVPELSVSAMWHPRMDADPGHRWLRSTITSLFEKLLSR
jgi:DNA-binding transcriptional LysR family regulator